MKNYFKIWILAILYFCILIAVFTVNEDEGGFVIFLFPISFIAGLPILLVYWLLTKPIAKSSTNNAVRWCYIIIAGPLSIAITFSLVGLVIDGDLILLYTFHPPIIYIACLSSILSSLSFFNTINKNFRDSYSNNHQLNTIIMGTTTENQIAVVNAAPNFWESNKTLFKVMLIGFLILIMLIPSAYIQSLVSERKERQKDIIEEVSSKWADAQTVTGPILMIPYTLSEKQSDGKVAEVTHTAYFLPDDLKINGFILPETRHRSLFDVTVYRSDLSITGDFQLVSLSGLQINPTSLQWQKAKIVMGLNDARGLEDNVAIKWNDSLLQLDAGMEKNGAVENGLNAAVPLSMNEAVHFSLKLKLKGSQYLYFTPLGKSTEVVVHSKWQNPAFDGKFLPNTTADITDSGFTAKWKVLQSSLSYPQSWIDSEKKLTESSFGVRLIQPVDGYVKTERSVKYALLFIGLTFTIFLFVEILQKSRIHPLQYLLVGMALCIFYTLLLSFSEYLGFNIAYFISTIATVSLIGLYVWSVFKKGKTALGFGFGLTALYGYIFVLIQLQDYALIFGSIGLFIILAAVMYYSRKIDWYNAGKKQLVNA